MAGGFCGVVLAAAASTPVRAVPAGLSITMAGSTGAIAARGGPLSAALNARH